MFTTECPTCNYPYDVPEPGEYGKASPPVRAHFDAEDAEHQEMHKKKVAIFDELECWPRGTEARKELKAEGKRDLASDDVCVQLSGLHALAQAWYEKSLDQAVELGYWQGHPRHWREFEKLLDLDALFPEELAEAFRECVGPAPGKLIGPSMVWQPGDGEPEDE